MIFLKRRNSEKKPHKTSATETVYALSNTVRSFLVGDTISAVEDI